MEATARKRDKLKSGGLNFLQSRTMQFKGHDHFLPAFEQVRVSLSCSNLLLAPECFQHASRRIEEALLGETLKNGSSITPDSWPKKTARHGKLPKKQMLQGEMRSFRQPGVESEEHDRSNYVAQFTNWLFAPKVECAACSNSKCFTWLAVR